MPEQDEQIRLLIVDDHQLVRRGLRALLMAAKDIEVVGEARDGQEAIQVALELQPDVILMDIQTPRLDGLQATRQLASTGNPARVLILSMSADEQGVRRAAQAGAWGYQLKNSDRDELIAAVRSIHRGNRVASPAVANFFFDTA
jgi:DNA-binding NarL/FixJ family response regulator